jgi:hypothetical protein
MKEIQNIPIRVWPCPALHVLVWNRRYVNSAEKWAWQSNTISATPTPYVLSLLYVLINMLINLLNKNVFVTSPWFTYAGWNQFVPLLLLLLLTILTKYHSKNLGSNPWDIREKKMFCPSCLCNFCPAECPHLVRAFYYLWPIDRVLYFFQGDRGKVCMLLRE